MMDNLHLHQQESEHYQMAQPTLNNLLPIIDNSTNEQKAFETYTEDVVMKISDLKKRYPWMHPWLIRKRLLQDPDFITTALPSITDVEWILRFLSNRQRNASTCQSHTSLPSNSFEQNKSLASVSLSHYAVQNESSISSISGGNYNNNNMSKNKNASVVNLKNRTFDSRIPKKVRRQRVNFKPDEVQILQGEFQRSHYPDQALITKLATKLNAEVYRIQVWFANRRAKQRRLIHEVRMDMDQINPNVSSSPKQSSSHGTELNAYFDSFSNSDSDGTETSERTATSSIDFHNSSYYYRRKGENRLDNDLPHAYLPTHLMPRFNSDSSSSSNYFYS